MYLDGGLGSGGGPLLVVVAPAGDPGGEGGVDVVQVGDPLADEAQAAVEAAHELLGVAAQGRLRRDGHLGGGGGGVRG